MDPARIRNSVSPRLELVRHKCSCARVEHQLDRVVRIHR